MADYQIAIIGGGFCGTLVAAGCARRQGEAKVALFERRPIAGPGLAYGTEDGGHLLNARAANMGAWPENPSDFLNWLEAKGRTSLYGGTDFVPRHIYGDYLREQLEEARQRCPGLEVLKRHVISVRRASGHFSLLCQDGAAFTADRVVLALGNFPPAAVPIGDAIDPYSSETALQAADDGDVLIVGTGLTALDIIVTLARTKRVGVIHLLSRHGLLPREHLRRPGPDVPHPFVTGRTPTSALALLLSVRAHVDEATASGHSWQAAVDGLRPVNQRLWHSLKTEERLRFLRHLRAYWDVHRHRAAPEVLDAFRKLEGEGRIRLHRGSVISERREGLASRVAWRRRGSGGICELKVRHIIHCTGPASDFAHVRDPLVQDLLETGLIVPDPLHLGILTDRDYRVVGRDGTVGGLFALGSLLKGRLYETVAVPELRQQAADVAQLLSAAL